MTTEQRLERDLPSILGDLAMGPYPDYIDDVLSATGRKAQRPSWTFPERWLPVELVSKRATSARMPWRQFGVLALIAILTAAAIAVYIGANTPRLPPPFGRAANGLVAYVKAGDIYTVDPKTNVSTLIVGGVETDSLPTWSRDGTRMAFVRRTSYGDVVYAMDKDGSDVVPVSDPKLFVSELSFSPDGSLVVFTAGPDYQRDLWLANTRGTPDLRQIDVGMSVSRPNFRPPDGSEIVFAELEELPIGRGLFAVNVETRAVRTILTAVPGTVRDWITLSPDGSRIAYSAATDGTVRNTYVVHIVGADGTGDRALSMPASAIFQDGPSWSNDGQRLAVARGYGARNTDMVLAVVPADGSSTGLETKHGLTGCCDTVADWAPDDTTILVLPFDLNGQPKPQILWDPETASTRPVPWGADSGPAWQRIGG